MTTLNYTKFKIWFNNPDRLHLNVINLILLIFAILSIGSLVYVFKTIPDDSMEDSYITHLGDSYITHLYDVNSAYHRLDETLMTVLLSPSLSYKQKMDVAASQKDFFIILKDSCEVQDDKCTIVYVNQRSEILLKQIKK